MKEEKIVNQIKTFHMMWLSVYIAKVVSIYCKTYKVNELSNYNEIYKTCTDTIIYSESERQQIYQMVNHIVVTKYNLKIKEE